ncbi:hypothetical protein [Blastococcus sp. CT_GayMR16]|uniref:hypothetical protein n=1 Tax=Blastococcus sp. CT_GayMR16 TaxID=2559607 RepID=UPI00107363E2|nr:hypothetical protein [Blastococcus sp. CT_GayMR16]TFV89902.1 hypothetical protein E4P38_05465 [Blastococcus sp. CT_GayMR16]
MSEGEFRVVTGDWRWDHPCDDAGGATVTSNQARVYKDGSMQLFCSGCNDGGGWLEPPVRRD